VEEKESFLKVDHDHGLVTAFERYPVLSWMLTLG
jgi:hypothetical protein